MSKPLSIRELRAPKVEELGRILATHQERGCNATDLEGAIVGSCACVPHRMFLFDLIHHEPTEEEAAALEGGSIPDFLRLGVGGWDKL